MYFSPFEMAAVEIFSSKIQLTQFLKIPLKGSYNIIRFSHIFTQAFRMTESIILQLNGYMYPPFF